MTIDLVYYSGHTTIGGTLSCLIVGRDGGRIEFTKDNHDKISWNEWLFLGNSLIIIKWT